MNDYDRKNLSAATTAIQSKNDLDILQCCGMYLPAGTKCPECFSYGNLSCSASFLKEIKIETVKNLKNVTKTSSMGPSKNYLENLVQCCGMYLPEGSKCPECFSYGNANTSYSTSPLNEIKSETFEDLENVARTSTETPSKKDSGSLVECCGIYLPAGTKCPECFSYGNNISYPSSALKVKEIKAENLDNFQSDIPSASGVLNKTESNALECCGINRPPGARCSECFSYGNKPNNSPVPLMDINTGIVSILENGSTEMDNGNHFEYCGNCGSYGPPGFECQCKLDCMDKEIRDLSREESEDLKENEETSLFIGNWCEPCECYDSQVFPGFWCPDCGWN